MAEEGRRGAMVQEERPHGKHFAHVSGGRPCETVAPERISPDDTSVFLAAAARSVSHAPVPALRSVRAAAVSQPVPAAPGAPAEDLDEASDEELEKRAEKSSIMLSMLVVVSRITGFVRTSAQAWGLGLTGLASAYTIATHLPNNLYELVTGGMLITSFLPVYVSVKKRLGREGASAYASNLLSIVFILMGVLTVLSLVFAAPIVWTQSAGAVENFDFDLAVWFFRFFACEVILYGLSSLISGVLNAEREYFWSNAAPILNNLITIASFGLYGYCVNIAGVDAAQAVVILAVGHPLGVAAQAFVQVPAMFKHGIRPRLRVDLRDPALRETLSVGLPTLLVTFIFFVYAAVASSSALSVTEVGPTMAYYSRVWYVLPVSVFATPITMTLFTELSTFRARGNWEGFIGCFSNGMRKISFTLIPFMMLLVVFAPALIAVFATGKFTSDAAQETAAYLQALSLALPFYGVCNYLQNVCSAMLRMKFFAFATCLSVALASGACIVLTPIFGILVVPLSSVLLYGSIVVVTLIRLRMQLGQIGMGSVIVSILRAVAFGALGSLVGWLILQALSVWMGPCEGLVRGLLYAAAGGFPALIVTFGLASALKMSDAPFFDALFGKLLRRR